MTSLNSPYFHDLFCGIYLMLNLIPGSLIQRQEKTLAPSIGPRTLSNLPQNPVEILLAVSSLNDT